MVRSEGLEPPTPWFEAKYSIQLSYERVFDTEFQGLESVDETSLACLIIRVYYNGGPCKNRTYDQKIKSLLLYRLS